MGPSRSVRRLVSACTTVGKYQPQDLLRWLVADVLADFGIRHPEPPPTDIRPWLHETAGEYARAVEEQPYVDVLGIVYQELGSMGHRRALGQYFTPHALSSLIGSLVVGEEEGHARARPDGGLWRACEPACGSGALIMGFLSAMTERHGQAALAHWSISAIDLDSLCARICAAQVLANLLVHRRTVGELVVYQGNALGPASGLSVVVHTTVANLTADVVLPALHPSRARALAEAARLASAGALPTEDDRLSAPAIVAASTSATNRGENRPHAAVAPDEVDLFAAWRA